IGLAAGLLVGGAVGGLPAGWGGAVGLSLANLVDLGLGQIGDASIILPFRIAITALSAAGGLALCLVGLGLTVEEREWIAARRAQRERERDNVPVDTRPAPEPRQPRAAVASPAEAP